MKQNIVTKYQASIFKKGTEHHRVAVEETNKTIIFNEYNNVTNLLLDHIKIVIIFRKAEFFQKFAYMYNVYLGQILISTYTHFTQQNTLCVSKYFVNQ